VQVLPWREAGPPSHQNDKVDSDQEVVNQELSLVQVREGEALRGPHLPYMRICAEEGFLPSEAISARPHPADYLNALCPINFLSTFSFNPFQKEVVTCMPFECPLNGVQVREGEAVRGPHLPRRTRGGHGSV